ncbi:MAG: DUF692 family protein [Planctomycetota bacterium]
MTDPFDRFVGVGLGVDVHSPPDWRAVLESGIPCDFFEVYTRGDLAGAEAVRAAAGDLPLLYHDDALDPAYPAPPDPELLATCVANMRAVGAPWCVSELATRRLGERYLDFFQPMLLNEEAARAAADNMRRLDEALPGRVLAENPPYQLPVGPWHVLDALAWVTDAAQIPCVLDLGHLYSFQLCRGHEPLTGLDGFPLERVWELHVAGAQIDASSGVPLYHDAHGAAEIPEVLLEMLAEVAPRCPELRAITIEVEDADLERTARQVAHTRAAVQGLLDARSAS